LKARVEKRLVTTNRAGAAGRHVERALRRGVQMEAVATGADEPRRDLVGVVALGARVVERQGLDAMVELIERVELLSEPEDVLVGNHGTGDSGRLRCCVSPIADLVTEHALAGKAQLTDYSRVAHATICPRWTPEAPNSPMRAVSDLR
jgi:hypothetical protein